MYKAIYFPQNTALAASNQCFMQYLLLFNTNNFSFPLRCSEPMGYSEEY